MIKFKSVNPYTQETIDEIRVFSDKEIDACLQTAGQAVRIWAATTPEERVEWLQRVSVLLQEEREYFARRATLEMGKAVREARQEIDWCAALCEYYATNGLELLAAPVPGRDQGEQIRGGFGVKTYSRPLGGVLLFTSAYYPFWEVFRMAIPALLAGNICLLRPAPQVSRCGLLVEKLFQHAGLPDGAFQTLIAPVERLKKVIKASWLGLVGFNGPEREFAEIGKMAGKNLKRTIVETGSNDPMIVLADCNLHQAAQAAVRARFHNAGQGIWSPQRFIVEAPVAAAFAEQVREELEKYIFSDPIEEATHVGPLVSTEAADRLHMQVTETALAGAHLLTGGRQFNARYAPTLLTNVQPGTPLFDQIAAGPVIGITTAKDAPEAVHLANFSRYSTHASLWTADERAEEMAVRLDANQLFINTMPVPCPELAVEPAKKSGYGYFSGPQGFYEMMQVKSVLTGR